MLDEPSSEAEVLDEPSSEAESLDEAYTVEPAGPVLRATQNGTIPLHVADALFIFMSDRLAKNPQRSGGPLDPPYGAKWSAHLALEWRVVYTIDEPNRHVIVTACRRRSDVYGVR